MIAPRERSAQAVKCLIVDDLKENLLALGALLGSDEVEVLTASSGVEALELLLDHDVALVLLDVQMPEMDGFEVAELMRGSDRTRHVPIIFITAGAHDQSRVFRGYETGAVDFLHKPVDSTILRNKASVFFELHRHRQWVADELREREHSLRVNEMLMAVLGHDLRSPLHAIALGAELLPRLSSDARVNEISQRIQSSSRHMRDMIEDLLDLTRARLGGGLPMQPESANLGAIVQRVVQEVSPSFPSRAIEVQFDGELGGEWDPGRLRQLVGNLLGNALKHGSAGAPVRVQADGRAPQLLSLTVSNGGHIDEAVMARLFDPFHGSRSSRRSDGLGLGLYIAQQIALAHGGHVQVTSDPVRGTAAIATLPRRSSVVETPSRRDGPPARTWYR